MSSNLTISIAESKSLRHTYLENRILNQRKNILFEYQDIRGTSKDVKLKNNLEPRVQRYAPEEVKRPARSPSGYLKTFGFSITFASQMSVPFENSP